MTEKPDMQELAGRFLDLWQQQMASLVNDPAISDLMAKSQDLVRERWEAAMTSVNERGAPSAGAHDRAKPDSPAARAAAAPVSPDDPSQQLAVLTSRIVALEERLAQLERAARPPGRGPARTARGARSK
jgi:hypothetical protein